MRVYAVSPDGPFDKAESETERALPKKQRKLVRNGLYKRGGLQRSLETGHGISPNANRPASGYCCALVRELLDLVCGELRAEMVAIGKLVVLGVVLVVGVAHGYQVKPRNYDKIVEQQMKFNGKLRGVMKELWY